MKHLRRYLPLPVLLLMLAGSISSCRDAGVRDALQRAEALMETDPHAARAVLDSLMPNVDCQTSDSQTVDECLGKGSRAKVLSDSLNGQSSESRESALSLPSREVRRTKFKSVSLKSFSRKDVADYAWLKVQTDYKCDIPLTTDTLALIATNYYDTPRRKNYHAAMAWYTLGCAYTDMQDDPKAINAYLKARDYFPDTTSRYYPLTLQNLGRHYLNRRMLDEAYTTFIRFRNASEAIGASVSFAYAQYYLGFTHLLQFKYEDADSLFNVLLASDTLPSYCRTQALLHKAKIAFYSCGDHPQAFVLLKDCREAIQADSLFAPGFCLMGDIFAAEHQLDSAYFYYEKALGCKNELYSLANTYHHLGDVIILRHGADEAKTCIDQYDLLLDSIYRRRNRDDISSVTYAYESEKREAAYRSDLRLYYVYGVASAAVMLLTILLVNVARRNHRKAQSLKVHESLRRNELVLARTSWQQWAELNDKEKARRLSEYAETLTQCRTIFRQTPSEHILLLLEKKDTRLTAKMTKAVADDIGNSFIDAIQFLRMEMYPDAAKISEADWLLCILSYLRMPQSRIAELLAIEKDSVRKKRRRLEAKIPAEILALFFSRDDGEPRNSASQLETKEE